MEVPSKDGKIVEVDKRNDRRFIANYICRRNYSYVGNTSSMWQHLEEGYMWQHLEEGNIWQHLEESHIEVYISQGERRK